MGTSHVSLLNQLESLHIKAVKLIHSIPSKMNGNEVLDIEGWKPLPYIYKRRLASIMFQIHSETVPKQTVELFERKDSSIRELRSKNRFIQNRPRIELGRNTIRFRGPSIWGVIPPEIEDLKDPGELQKETKIVRKKLDLVHFDNG